MGAYKMSQDKEGTYNYKVNGQRWYMQPVNTAEVVEQYLEWKNHSLANVTDD